MPVDKQDQARRKGFGVFGSGRTHPLGAAGPPTPATAWSLDLGVGRRVLSRLPRAGAWPTGRPYVRAAHDPPAARGPTRCGALAAPAGRARTWAGPVAAARAAPRRSPRARPARWPR